MKLVEFELNKQKYHLMLSGAALFEAYDRFGDTGDLLEQVIGTSMESFENTVWMLVNLAKHGEVYRRHMGEEPLPMLSVETARRTMGPKDVVRARSAIRKALAVGFEREELNEEQEIDLGLLELQKKTGLGLRRRSGLAEQLNFLGFLTRKP